MIEIDVNLDDYERKLTKYIALARDMSPLNRGLVGILADIPERAFAEEADPSTGDKWAELSPVTIKRRGNSGPILQVSGQLAGEMASDYGPDFARVTAGKEYAPTHQYGAEQGEFGTTSRGGPIPWGDIPARPFFGVGERDKDDMQDFLQDALQRLFDD